MSELLDACVLLSYDRQKLVYFSFCVMVLATNIAEMSVLLNQLGLQDLHHACTLSLSLGLLAQRLQLATQRLVFFHYETQVLVAAQHCQVSGIPETQYFVNQR